MYLIAQTLQIAQIYIFRFLTGFKNDVRCFKEVGGAIFIIVRNICGFDSIIC